MKLTMLMFDVFDMSEVQDLDMETQKYKRGKEISIKVSLDGEEETKLEVGTPGPI
jgi:hypothetical protein